MDVAAATVGFLLLHILVARLARASYTRNLKLSRGLAGAVLVATGAAALARWWSLWPQAFLTVHPSRADAWPVAVLAGHLLADLLWFAWGHLFLSSRAARDLVIHHLIGLGACAAALLLEAGYAVLGVILLSEVLPVLTGLGAWARMRGRLELERRILQTSLGAVAGFRIPLWLFLFVVFTATLAGGAAPAIHRTVAPIVFLGLAGAVILDLYWCGAYVRLLRDFPERGIPDVPVDPLAPLLPGGEL